MVAIFALGAAIGKSTAFNKLNATLFLGILLPIKGVLFDNFKEILLLFFLVSIKVNGPGQNSLANFNYNSFILKCFFTSVRFLKWHIKGLFFGLFFIE